MSSALICYIASIMARSASGCPLIKFAPDIIGHTLPVDADKIETQCYRRVMSLPCLHPRFIQGLFPRSTFLPFDMLEHGRLCLLPHVLAQSRVEGLCVCTRNILHIG